MTNTNPVIGVLLFALCLAGWPLFLFACFHSHPRGITIVLGLALVTFLIGSFLGGFRAERHGAALLYSWLALPYLLTLFRFVRRRRARSESAPPAVAK